MQFRALKAKKNQPDKRLDLYMVELGGFEPPSASLFRADLHV